MNFIGVPAGPLSESFRSLSTTISAAFDHAYVSHTKGESIQNIMIVACVDPMIMAKFYPAPTDGYLLTDDLNPIEIFFQRALAGTIDYRR